LRAGCRATRLATEFPIEPTHKAPEHFADAEHGNVNLGADGGSHERDVVVGNAASDRALMMSDVVKLARQDDTYAWLSGRALIWINANAVSVAIGHPMDVAIDPRRRKF
jgi:hypothetical protein